MFPLVREFFPSARNITYLVEVKIRMVLKAKDVISSGCLEFDVAWTDSRSVTTPLGSSTDSGRPCGS
ncbi:hypothetical protein [Lysobacter gummosus]|uniref:hypothetical protein n=1 Tax=Lysobacter gummosus TaxID=262324 RepID=UPI00362E49B5